ncbi:MAG: YbaB/EbfC family nucleoid-associated protein [Rhodospirillales bacterium]|nr:YbaB/EbfC family nucleoid-associated protein [Rhodospirillales bacterium]
MNLQQMMKQAKVMQERMEQMQAELAQQEVTGSSGGGMVNVTMTCKGEVRKIDISPDVINPADKETLEDLIMAAMNTARANADSRLGEETQKMMSELGLPAGMDLPF